MRYICDMRLSFRSAVPSVAISLLLLLGMPDAAAAQQSGNGPTGGSGGSSSFGEGAAGDSSDRIIILQGDGPIIGRLEQVAQVCALLPRRHRIHCLAYQYEALAAQIPATAEYHDMRIAIQQAARSLRQLASANVDPAAPTVRVPRVAERVPSIARRQVPAVRSDTLEQTARAAEAILEETQTILLRSAENTRNRSVAYQRVAAAIDSSKVLLRSS